MKARTWEWLDGIPYYSDGDDKLFGDLGNDWLVGGTGRDNIYGGWGDDLLNADDDHSTNGGLNDGPDTHPSYEDRAYGGAGRDGLIANTGGDRLIDWAGEFNSYIVPFAPFGLGTVSRALQPQIAEFLYALSESDGADFTRSVDAGATRAQRRAVGELGLVRQQDCRLAGPDRCAGRSAAGQHPGGARDVLRSASFDDGSRRRASSPTAARWQVPGGALQVVGRIARRRCGQRVPRWRAAAGYFEMMASVKIVTRRPAGWKANAYVIFDYQNELDFKFAGIDDSINKLVMGHRDASGWHVDDRRRSRVVSSTASRLQHAGGDQRHHCHAGGEQQRQVFTAHLRATDRCDGYAYGLNYGYVGVGSDNSRGTFDNVRVQILPPQVTFDDTEDFQDGQADLFTGGSVGTWTVDGGRYRADPVGSSAMSLLDLGPDHLNFNAFLELSATVNTQTRAGFVFDRYGEESFKFAVIDAMSDQLVIGHYTSKDGWNDDAVVSTVIDAGKDYTLGVTLKGTTVSATVSTVGTTGFEAIVGHAFNAATVDGNFGLLADTGPAGFDDVEVKTDDPAFSNQGETFALIAATMSTGDSQRQNSLTREELDPIIEEAVSRWAESSLVSPMMLSRLDEVAFLIADLSGGILGLSVDTTVMIDVNAAGYGWFVDDTPYQDAEYMPQSNDRALVANQTNEAYGAMDLLTVVMHELGHVFRFEDLDPDADGLMSDTLDTGIRRVLEDTADPYAAAVDQLLTQIGQGDEDPVWRLHGDVLGCLRPSLVRFVTKVGTGCCDSSRGRPRWRLPSPVCGEGKTPIWRHKGGHEGNIPR